MNIVISNYVIRAAREYNLDELFYFISVMLLYARDKRSHFFWLWAIKIMIPTPTSQNFVMQTSTPKNDWSLNTGDKVISGYLTWFTCSNHWDWYRKDIFHSSLRFQTSVYCAQIGDVNCETHSTDDAAEAKRI